MCRKVLTGFHLGILSWGEGYDRVAEGHDEGEGAGGGCGPSCAEREAKNTPNFWTLITCYI